MFGFSLKLKASAGKRPKEITSNESLPTTGMAFKLTRKQIKGVYLRIDRHSEQIRVSAPHLLPLPLIYQFLLEKQEWIHQKQAQIKSANTQRGIQPPYSDNQTITLLGQNHLIRIQHDKGPEKGHKRGKDRALINGNVIEIHTRSSPIHPHKLQELINQQLKIKLKEYLLSRLPYWSAQIGVTVNHVGIRRMKTRWGSCNIRDKRISINLALVHLPEHCIDMVLVHELVHLHERYHNARFYRLMDQFMPDWRKWHTILDKREPKVSEFVQPPE